MIQIPIDILRKQLVESGLVAEVDFDKAVHDARRGKQNIIDVLVSRRLIDYEYYINLVSEFFHVPRADSVAPDVIPQEVLHLLNEDVARQKRAVVFSKLKDGTFQVAMENPNDLEAVGFLEKYLRGNIKTYIATEKFLNAAFTLYSQISTENFITVIEENIKESERRKLGGLDEAAEDIPIVSIVDNLVAYAIAVGASDIHIEPLEDIIIVRFRVDGMLREVLRVSTSVHSAVVARVKLLATLRIDEHAKPQDGRFRYKVSNEIMDIRVAVMPTFHGEKIVMRLLRASSKPLSFADLGMLPETTERIKSGLAKSYGILLVTGPTGSGKSTSIYSMIDLLNKPEVNIVTIEDPVEYHMRYVNQTQVNEAAGINFANALRAFLRQDPNIILVGEIRDSETANIAVNAALTGHLVLASLHTNDAPTAVPRLMDMGVPPFLVSAVINIILAQRLTRRICSSCISSHTPDEGTIEAIKSQMEISGIKDSLPSSYYKGGGCSSCGGSGYRGRLAIFEVAEVGPSVRKIVSGPDFTLTAMKDKLREGGMKTMFQDGLHKVEQGMTTLEEVLRVIRE